MKIIKKIQPGWLVYVLVLMPFALGTLTDFLGLPRMIRYGMDLAWCMLAALAAFRLRRIRLGEECRFLAIWVVDFLVYTLIAYLFLFQSPLFYLWGFRNNFRFYAAFFAFVLFLTPDGAKKTLKLFDILFWVNCVVTLVQFFVFKLEQDYLGGIFGTEQGVNGYTVLFFMIIITKSVVFYLEGQEKLWVFVSKCGAVLLISALAELKFFYVAFLGILFMAVLFTRFRVRNLWILGAGIAAAVISAALLSKLFPYFENFFSIRWFISEATSHYGYSSAGDLNRLTVIPAVNSLWLKNLPQQAFGLGLGNTDTASFAFLNTPFFQTYGELHYTWITYAALYLECGWTGLLFYFGFFGLVFVAVCRLQKQSEGVRRIYCLMVKILAPMCVLLAIYNSSLRVESAYLIYFVLALPFMTAHTAQE